MLSIILFTILLTAAIEFFTITARLVYHLRSVETQKKLNLPRIHHSYAGALLLFFYWLSIDSTIGTLFTSQWTLIIAISLITSDALHHLLFLPLIQRYRYDIDMIDHQEVHRALSRAIGIVLIIIGLLALLIPFTPGSWLIVIGTAALIGKKRTRHICQRILGKRLCKKLKIASFLKDRKVKNK